LKNLLPDKLRINHFLPDKPWINHLLQDMPWINHLMPDMPWINHLFPDMPWINHLMPDVVDQPPARYAVEEKKKLYYSSHNRLIRRPRCLNKKV
jgi:hypothetical protein